MIIGLLIYLSRGKSGGCSAYACAGDLPACCEEAGGILVGLPVGRAGREPLAAERVHPVDKALDYLYGSVRFHSLSVFLVIGIVSAVCISS